MVLIKCYRLFKHMNEMSIVWGQMCMLVTQKCFFESKNAIMVYISYFQNQEEIEWRFIEGNLPEILSIIIDNNKSLDARIIKHFNLTYSQSKARILDHFILAVVISKKFCEYHQIICTGFRVLGTCSNSWKMWSKYYIHLRRNHDGHSSRNRNYAMWKLIHYCVHSVTYICCYVKRFDVNKQKAGLHENK